MSDQAQKPETLALHAGWRADPATGAVAVPIYQIDILSVRRHRPCRQSVRAEGTRQHLHAHHEPDQRRPRAARSRRWRAASPRSRSPPGRRLRPSRSRISRAPATISSASTDLYGGTWNLFANTLKDHGHRGPLRRSEPTPRTSASATDDRTRAYYAETLPNPKLVVLPIAEVAAIGRALGIPLIVDNTAAPLIARPLDHGAAIVVYSSTKYLGGHGTSIGGLIVDGGNFDWEDFPERQPRSTRPTRAITARSGPKRSSRSARSPISSARA